MCHFLCCRRLFDSIDLMGLRRLKRGKPSAMPRPCGSSSASSAPKEWARNECNNTFELERLELNCSAFRIDIAGMLQDNTSLESLSVRIKKKVLLVEAKQSDSTSMSRSFQSSNTIRRSRLEVYNSIKGFG
jgi:hypothetical protein